MKQTLRRIPGLVTAYRHAQLLTTITRERWWMDRERMNDRAILEQHWHFDSPAEQARHRSVLAAVSARRGDSWGEVLEIGCAEGLFTAELTRRAASVTAYDVSSVACERTSRKLPQVHVRRVNIERDAVPGVFDIVFAMDVLGYIHGRGTLGRVARRLAGAVRGGGLLVLTEQRLHLSSIEDCRWARWLVEGGLQILRYLDGRDGLHLAHRELHRGYVVGLYDKRM